MEKLYIKFEEGNQESLDRACKEAERLGYKKLDNEQALDFEGYGLIKLDEDGPYFTTKEDEVGIIKQGYKEHKIEEKEDAIEPKIQGRSSCVTYEGGMPQNIIEPTLEITYKGVSFYGDTIEEIKEKIERKISDRESELRLLKNMLNAI